MFNIFNARTDIAVESKAIALVHRAPLQSQGRSNTRLQATRFAVPA